jgi:hypothetical protein
MSGGSVFRRRLPDLAILLICASVPLGLASASGAGKTRHFQPPPKLLIASQMVQAAQQQPAQQQPAQPKVPAPPKPPAPPPDNVELLPDNQVVGLLGKKAQDPKGEDMGMVVDIIVDKDGNPRALVIDFGGFLGVGSRKIAIDWRLVHLRPENHDAPVLLNLSRAEVQDAPVFDPSVEPLRMMGPPAGKPVSPNAGQ